MRRSKPKTVYDSSGTFVGYDMAGDFCAEHEWGIKTILDRFGVIAEAGPGYHRRAQTKFPQDNVTIVIGSKGKKDPSLLLFSTVPKREIDAEYFLKNKHDELFLMPKEEVAAAWSDKDFGILARSDTERDNLFDLQKAIGRNDVVICLRSTEVTNPFARPGLFIAIASRLPEEDKKMMLDADKSNDRLRKTADGIGIERKLKAAGKKWFSLRPRWANETETEVKFWLNPADQMKYQGGWYSAEELEQWIKEEGPVIK